MLGLGCIPVIHKTSGQAFQNMRTPLDFTQQQAATVGTDLATVELPHHNPAAKTVKFQLIRRTLCLYKAVFPLGYNFLFAQMLCHEKQPYSILFGEKSGLAFSWRV